MSRSAFSVFVFGLYLSVLGTILLIAPNSLLRLFAFAETDEVWIRVVGMLLAILACYYIHASQNEVTIFFRATVYGRCSIPVFFMIFVALDFAPPMLILFVVVDAMGGVWTALALRADRRGEQLAR